MAKESGYGKRGVSGGGTSIERHSSEEENLQTQIKKRSVKLFKDNVHSYIEVPNAIVKSIVDTELFQRLKDVRQTGMQPLYPAVQHSRFIHSLGVYHLGKQAFARLKANAREFIGFKHDEELELLGRAEFFELTGKPYGRAYGNSGDQSDLPIGEAWWRKYEVLFALACLLHDCAHAPFSHTYEGYYKIPKGTIDDDYLEQVPCARDELPAAITKLDMNLLRQFPSRRFLEDFYELGSAEGLAPTLAKDKAESKIDPRPREDAKNGKGAPHERLSATVMGIHFREACHQILWDLAGGARNPLLKSPQKIREEREAALAELDDRAKDEVKAGIRSLLLPPDPDLEFMARAIIGLPYRYTNSDSCMETSLKNCFIGLLNSDTFDVDGLDYAMRDAKNAGLGTADIDCERLFRSLRVMRLIHVEKERARGDVGGLWLAGLTLKPKVAADSPSLRITGEFKITRKAEKPEESEESEESDEDPLPAWIREVGAGTDHNGDRKHRISQSYDEETCRLEFQTSRGAPACVELELADATDIEITAITHVWLEGTYQGAIDGWLIDQDWASARSKDDGVAPRHASTRSEHYEYDFVYDHSCLSILNQIMAARNFEYEWVFTHPKVLFSIFLLGYLPRLSSRFICCKHNRDTSCFGQVPLSFEKCEIPANEASDGDEPYVRCDLCASEDEDELVPKIIGFDSFYALDPEAYFAACSERGIEGPGYEHAEDGYWFWRSNDDDMRALFKRIYLENLELKDPNGQRLTSEHLARYFRMFFDRQHLKPLWKSQGEFREIFKPSEFDPNELEELANYFAKIRNSSSVSYAILEGSVEQVLEGWGISNPVTIAVDKKVKRLDPEKMFVLTSSYGIVPMDELGVIPRLDPVSDSFYYLYGRWTPGTTFTYRQIRIMFHDMVVAIRDELEGKVAVISTEDIDRELSNRLNEPK